MCCSNTQHFVRDFESQRRSSPASSRDGGGVWRRIANIFNKREEDFSSLREYNDYLEEVEDMTCNLIEGIDVPAIEAKIAKYQTENAEQIINARARKAEEVAAALEGSKGNSIRGGSIDVGAGPSSQGVAQGSYAPTTLPGGYAQPRPTGMAPQPVPLGGSVDPLQGYAGDDEETMKIRTERGARAGGWTVELSKRRAIEEAFSSLCV